MADVQIKDLTQVLVNNTSPSDIYVLQIYDSTVGDFVTRKITAGDLGACLVSQIGYTLVLETTAKTVLAAINEVNDKAGTNADDIDDLNDNVTLLALNQAYQDTDEVSLLNCVFPLYDDGTDLHFTIPLSKPILTGLEATLTGSFLIDGNSVSLSTDFTTTIDISDVGLNVTLTPTSQMTIVDKYIVCSTNSKITFAEEEV